MKKFEFQKHGFPLTLDIAGHVFTLLLTEEVSQKLQGFGAQAQRLDAELSDTPEGEALAWAFMQDAVNGLLGENATDRIFEGRTHNLKDIVDVMEYICTEITDAAKQKKTIIRDAPVPQTEGQQSIQQALRIMQNPDVMAAVAKAMGQA